MTDSAGGPQVLELGKSGIDLWPQLRAFRDSLAAGSRAQILRVDVAGVVPGDRSLAGLLRLNGFVLVDAWSDDDSGGSGWTSLTVTKEPLPLSPLTCTVVVPCRNEAGNVAELVDRVPVMGPHTEIIFVDGASTDGTQERVEECIRANPNRDIKLLHQRGGGGKAAAVFQGFDAAAGDVVMILDADMTVAPEDLPRFWHAIAEDRADFVNGSRLIYPMDAEAMPPLNLLGNRAFSGLLSVLTGTRLSDTLCGTKAMHRSDWQRIRAVRRRFGGHDVWGDFDLLLGAGLVGMRIVDMPIVYGARQSGESKMRPLAHGLALGRTCATGALAITRQRVFGRWSA